MSPFSWAATEQADTPLAAAYAACARLARQHDRTYALQSRLLPAALRSLTLALALFYFGSR